MKFIRLYTGDDGHTHIEELDWESRPDYTDLHHAQGVVFRAAEVGRFQRLARRPPPSVCHYPGRRG